MLPNESATYGEMFREALRIAKSLKYFGISKGDPVGILMANSVRYVESLCYLITWSSTRSLQWSIQIPEISHVTKDSGIKIILTSDKADEFTNFAELLAKAIPGIHNSTDPQKHLSWRIIRISSELCCSAKRTGRFSK
ncbi:MAG: hypothetical protein CM15mP49_06070 [Actinomycetota bacterium]|nr:MAG: hypothetical protein CM15mP49_06070 [Actinomycetota bacterium]